MIGTTLLLYVFRSIIMMANHVISYNSFHSNERDLGILFKYSKTVIDNGNTSQVFAVVK